ncbi:ATP-binding cassette domain-containing protein [Aquabacterium sp.]|uniref:ABC transporter ATP-binding protein n=1 Tax=Aquabacterium sp. TaxID=1872578 RepID=UPI0035B3C27E
MTEVQHPHSATHVVSVRDLSFGFAERQPRLFDGWSHVFSRGLTWLKGGNGVGKSTLLRLLAGTQDGYAGHIAVLGHDERQQPADFRKEVFYCGAAGMPVGYLSVVDYFLVLKQLYPRFDVVAWRRHISGFQLDLLLSSPIRALSLGAQRKVWLAAALSVGASVVLMDDPRSALDRQSTAHLLRSLDELARQGQQAIVIASHEDLGPAGADARVVVLEDQA